MGIAGYGMLAAMAAILSMAAPRMPSNPSLDDTFHLMYELRFEAARTRLAACRQADPENPLCKAAEAASYLFERFHQDGVFTSAFFLDDKRLLGGVPRNPDTKLDSSFLEANQHARGMAESCLKKDPRHSGALLTLALTDGMRGDFEALIEKHPIDSLRYTHRAEEEAEDLLLVEPDNGDAYVALGAANYIIGCMPIYKKFVLWFGGIHGDRVRGMNQLEVAATRGQYLQPLAKTMLALASEREHQYDRARTLFSQLHQDFPSNPVFAQELMLLQKH